MSIIRLTIALTSLMAIITNFICQYYRGEWQEAYFSDDPPDPSRLEFKHTESEDKFIEN